MRSAAVFLPLSLVLCALCGCALINPYPQPKPTPAEKAANANDAAGAFTLLCNDATTGTSGGDAAKLCEAYGYAERWRLTYMRAARQHSVARNTAALISIPLAAEGVFEGLKDDGSSDRIARLGVQAVGIYSLTNFLTSRPRQRVYLSGAKAMVCAMFEARPFLVGAVYSTELETRTAAVESAAKALADALPPDFDSTAPANAPVLVARSDATSAVARARRLRGELRIAGMTFRNRVDLISTQVAELISDTEPSAESLNSLFTNFGSLTASFTQSVSAAAASRTGANLQSGFGTQLAALRDRTAELNATIASIGETTGVIDRISGCKPEGADSGFEVTPADDSVVVEVGKTFEFTVKNSIATPVRRLEGAQVDTLSLEPTTVKGDGQFGVVVKGLSPSGDNGPTLVITDGTGSRSKSIRLMVVGAPPQPVPSPPAAPAAALALSNEENELLTGAEITVRALQCYFGVSVDGAVGKETRDAIAGKRTSTAVDEQRKEAIDTALIVEVRAALDSTHKVCEGA